MLVFDILNNFKQVEENFQIGNSHYWLILKADELYKIKDILVLDEESLQECVNLDQFPKLSFYSGYMFIVFNILDYSNMEVVSKELNIFLSRDYIITVYKEELNIISGLIGDIRESKNTFILKEKPNASIVLYYILDRIILRNYEVISSIEAHADKIEISILKSPRNEHLEELIHLRRQVYKIRKYLNPLRYIGDGLISNENYIIETENIGYFKNLSTKIEKLMLSLESLVQDLALVREAFESEISNKTNELMKVFTLIASIFLPLNLITSMYGMNFKNIPFVELEHGYYIVTVIMLTISFGLLVLFKKKKWL
ncbi:magnesium transporter CorA family protein [Clostridium sp. YIM B02515]|uniref:Magnesium transporter CorA family protein n=1 Tax=Clostridium rhizosphaerae TaxID=2803861 RepID=A0ABS1T7Y8_9CLOT|nr:magnesium transporter CorA family protein [Clostridium rhizosphaerae]MBL4935232.1 magnesium transporter CorA family protein [Clostridium rhizosphaerae]